MTYYLIPTKSKTHFQLHYCNLLFCFYYGKYELAAFHCIVLNLKKVKGELLTQAAYEERILHFSNGVAGFISLSKSTATDQVI